MRTGACVVGGNANFDERSLSRRSAKLEFRTVQRLLPDP